jgi:hypothetical protein
MSWSVAETISKAEPVLWEDLADEAREALSGKLSGLWGAVSDEAAFNGLALDQQQALLIILYRLLAKGLWQVIRKIDNVYGKGGVGIDFSAWPSIESTLKARRDFTRFLAKHRNTTGGFYEKGRGDAVLHFLFAEGKTRKWHVHFDLYSPVHSPASALKHLRYEFLGKLTPDWRMIQRVLNSESASRIGV